MKIEELDIKSLKPYEKNPRVISDEAVEKVSNSIKEFGFQQPIVCDKDMVIIVGHTRLLAAKKLGLKKVPVLIANDLTDEQVMAYRLADNKTGELAKWDIAMLDEELAALFDLDMDMTEFGFDLKLDDDCIEKEEEPEIQFTKSLEEFHNFIVLYFDNEIDWLNAQSIFDIERVKELSTRNDGKKSFNKFGIGRVLKGSEALRKLVNI